MKNVCFFCKKDRPIGEYCIQVTTSQGTFCKTEKSTGVQIIYRQIKGENK